MLVLYLGGDDINQIMQCDEGEFLEIMSLVGMLSKPLHVRRLQRALTEFSKDQTTFNLAAIQHIGPPPVSPYALGGPDMSFLMPGFATTLTSLSSTSPGLASTSNETTSPQNGNATHNSVPLAIELSAAVLGTMATSVTIGGTSGCTNDFGPSPTVPGGTANVVRGELLPAFGQGSITGEEKERSTSPLSVGGDFVSLGDYDPSTALCDSPVLSDAQIRRLSSCAMAICQKIPRLPPKLIQNKKRVSKEVLDLLSATADSPNRLAEYRKYSAIYGRFDAKRKPDKGLSFHEVSVNEAAAQLCLIMPSLLTRRDELFPLARQVVKDAGYHYAKASRKRGFDLLDSHSPPGSPTQSSPCPGDDNEEVDSMFASALKQSDEKRKKSDTAQEKGTYLERWASSMLASQQSASNSPRGTQ
ncbi:NGFI-A-binding protein 2 [Trichostrongylus colubriformis]|uniref:NGFI-A-binding protein 2 n=1 Tax=Trichostrongylus colubriformis TaxID=6319 RepID=A0AAN8G725_TRICO